MKLFSFRSIAHMVLLLTLAAPLGSLAAEPLPEASVVTRRLIERANALACTSNLSPYSYQKKSARNHYDSDGKTIKTEEKEYLVTLVNGYPFNRLTKIQGRDLTEAELQKEQDKEERFRKKFVSGDVKTMASRKEAWVTTNLLDRFQFTVKYRTNINQRPTLVMEFKPRSGELPNKAIHDRVLNKIAGVVWIDEQESEAVKVDAHILEPVTIGWFGMLGSLSKCDMILERKQLEPGIWANLKQNLYIQYRKLASTTRFSLCEDSSDFKKAKP